MASTIELAQATNISSLYLGRDPNEKTNRVPTDLELKGLRALAVSNSHIAEFLDEEVEKLQASHKALSDRLLQQQRELEATQSQLCSTKKLIDTLRDQRSAVKTQMEELRGLMHPVRRLPVELLRAIFEEAIEIAESKLEMALKLSHVCRSWRETALDAPRLWREVTLRPFANSDAFWAAIIPRMKSIPVLVHVRGITEDSFPLLRRWQLSTIPNIENLLLRVPFYPTTQSLCEALLYPPYIPLKELTIIVEGGGAAGLDYTVQEGHFPSLLKLVIKAAGPLDFLHAPPPTITTLILDGTDCIDMRAVLRFPRLETLKLRSVTFEELQIQEGLTSHTVRFLELTDSLLFAEPWVAALRLPGLHSLYNDCDSTDLFVAFVTSHSSLKELDCMMPSGHLAVYAHAIPALTSLYVPRPFDEFVNWRQAGMAHVPFPSLKVVIMERETTSEEFEEMVCARCLPSNHPHSRLEPPTLPVDELRIILYPESDGWANALWAGHELAQSASIEVIPYLSDTNVFCASLRWESSTQTEKELKGLHALAVSNSAIVDFLDGEVEKLQASHKAFSIQLLQQQREIEATQSQLCATEKLISALLDQCSVVTSQMDELRGIMHPIRRLPVELLRAVFEEAMNIEESKIAMAFKLSHVCRLWRDAALDAPRLWCTIKLAPFATSDVFWAEIIPRMKSIPAFVYVEKIRDHHFALFRKWHLWRIPNLEKLVLVTSYASTVQPLCEALFKSPYIPLKDLTILLEEDAQREPLYSVQMGHFPSLLKLNITGNLPFCFQIASPPTITTLILDSVDDINIQEILRFPQLERLVLKHVTFELPIGQDGLTAPGIRRLYLDDSPLFEEGWVADLKFPGLTSLYHGSYPTELFVAFVVSHPTIKELDCVIAGDELATYASALLTLTSIYLAPPFGVFLNWREAGMLQAPFPSLEVVILQQSITSAEFEAVVRGRCLPLNHHRSLLEPNMLPVNELWMVGDSDSCSDAPWAQHELVLSASMKVVPFNEETDLFCVVYRWTGKASVLDQAPETDAESSG